MIRAAQFAMLYKKDCVTRKNMKYYLSKTNYEYSYLNNQ